ncbi:chaperonin 60 subunit beta [Wolffia australiana]
MVGWGALQGAMDVAVAGVSAAVGAGIFLLVASVLCTAAFINNSRNTA